MTTWGNSVGSGSGSTLTLGYDGIEVSGGNARLVNPWVQFYSSSGWSDSSNSITAQGSAITTTVVTSNVTLNGGTRTWYPAAAWVPISYGSTTSVTFQAKVTGISFFNGDGATSYYDLDVTLPARAYSLPDPATSLTASWASDSQANLGWVTHSTALNADKPWILQYIDRTESNNWASYTNISGAINSGSASSWSDTGLQANKRYDYRHYASNYTGASAYAYAAAPVYTTPAAPSAVVAAKNVDNSITVTATNEAPWANLWEFSDSPDGSTWTVVQSGASPTFTHTSPNQSITHRYRVRSRTPDGKWSAYSVTSNIVQLQSPPNPPTWASIDPAYDTTSTISTPFLHNSVDTTSMSAYEMQSRMSADNGATWSAWVSTTKITSTVQSRTWAANTWTQNRLVEIQVRTWGAHATASGWSASASLRTSARPTLGITAPANSAVLHGKTLAATWTYADAEGTAQSSYRVTLYQSGAGGALLGQWSGAGAATSYTPSYLLENNLGYRMTLEVRDGHGLWSSPAEATFTVSFLSPPAPTFTVSWDEEHGSALLAIVNPLPSGSEPASVSNNIYRDGVLVATGIPTSTTWTDRIPLPSGSSYTVESVSALPSTAPSTVALAAADSVRARFWLNAGSNWEIVASFWGNVKRGQTQGRNRSLDRYSGRELEVETLGEGRVSTFRLSGTLVLSEDSPSDFFAVANADTPVCYRDQYGSWFVSPGPISSEAENDAVLGISVYLSETDYVDPVRGS